MRQWKLVRSSGKSPARVRQSVRPTSIRGISNDPEQLFIGQGRDAPGLGDLVLVIEVENRGDKLGVDRELVPPAMLAVDHDCTELTGRDNLVLERQLADAGAG